MAKESHITSKWQRQDLGPSYLAPESALLISIPRNPSYGTFVSLMNLRTGGRKRAAISEMNRPLGWEHPVLTLCPWTLVG